MTTEHCNVHHQASDCVRVGWLKLPAWEVGDSCIAHYSNFKETQCFFSAHLMLRGASVTEMYRAQSQPASARVSNQPM